MNKVKEKLKDNKVCLGGWIQIGHPAVAEIMVDAGYDWIAIDNEHGIIDLETGMNIFNAMRGSNTLPMVRVQENNEIIIRRWCDAGAGGIIIPMINNAQQAQAAVQAAKYPTNGGKRGFGYCRANSYGANFEKYVSSSDDDMLIIVQIEHIEGVKNIDAILSVEGVDGAFIGPYDLSGSMGLTGQLYHKEVLDACKTVLNACKKHKKAPGIHVVPVDPERIRSFASQGFTFIAASIDTVFIRHGSENLINALKI
jgi:2-keto-3-deoxy-L-rhamnonate aldolase RhmA